MSDETDELDKRVVPLPRKDGGRRKCPICKAPAVHRFRPFCSQRCADIDLGRWVKGNYAIPTDEGPTGETPDAEGAAQDTPQDTDEDC